jgi:hypothetical protein
MIVLAKLFEGAIVQSKTANRSHVADQSPVGQVDRRLAPVWIVCVLEDVAGMDVALLQLAQDKITRSSPPYFAPEITLAPNRQPAGAIAESPTASIEPHESFLPQDRKPVYLAKNDINVYIANNRKRFML